MALGNSRMIYFFLALVLIFGFSKYEMYQLALRWVKNWVNIGTEGAKTEGAKPEGAKTEGVKTEGAKTEGVKTEGAKTEGVKTEGAKPEGAKTEGVKTEGVKTEGAKPEGAKITVLLWNWPFAQTLSLQGDVCRENYGVPDCHLVDNHSLYHQADVVVFHNRELQTGISRLPLDQPRPTAQKWVWLSLESPAHNGDLRPYGGLFNWTMTYRRDADIFTPYGELVPRTTEGDYIIPAKDTLACWVVSNYQPTHKRTEVYLSLKKLIPVEVYGHWAKKPLDSDQLLPTISRCYFYLAFENSVYRDYITEKLWNNALLAGSVPVVLGPPRANYETFIPKDSFIHVDDFNSTEKLADFLNQLASDKERYESYFHWRRDSEVKLWSDWREMLCTICSQYEDLPSSKVYSNLDTWSKKDP